MSIVKLNNRSVKDITQFGSITSLGSLSHISTQTASGASSIDFTSGIDSTFKEYIFFLVNIHGSSEAKFFINFRDGGSNFDAVKTTTNWRSYHFESASAAGVGYQNTLDLAQLTSDQMIGQEIGHDNDECGSGFLHLFNPSDTNFVKHFVSRFSHAYSTAGNVDNFVSGYCNTTAAIDGVTFKFSSGNIDSGQILLFGLN